MGTCVLRMISAKLCSAARKSARVGGLHSGRAGCCVTSKGIIELAVGLRQTTKQYRISADGNGQI